MDRKSKMMINKSLLSLISFMVLAILFATNPTAILANEYKVKAYIIVPANKKAEFDKAPVEAYKKGILQSLKTIQGFFAQHLLGKTFEFEDGVEVKQADKNIQDTADKTDQFFDQLDGYSLLPPNPKRIYAVWIYGGSAQTHVALVPKVVTDSDGYPGVTIHDQASLKSLATASDQDKYSMKSLALVAHELGHTFRMMKTKYANWHPCTQGTQKNCRNNPPEPLPDIEEYNQDIMGYEFGNYPDMTIHNTIHNSGVEIAFSSPWINPTKDPAPQPLQISGST